MTLRELTHADERIVDQRVDAAIAQEVPCALRSLHVRLPVKRYETGC